MQNNDLISRSALKSYIDCGHLCPPTEVCFSELDVVRMLDKFPAVDAEHVVRCKDCGLAETIGMGKGYVYCNHFNMAVFENDYCSYAEEKMDAEVSE